MVESCPRCERAPLRVHTRSLVRTVGGRRFSTAITIRRCEACDWSPLPIDAIEAHEATVAAQLALFGPATRETFSFLRHALRLDVEETARLAELELERTIRIEQGHERVPLRAWMKLARCVRDRAAAQDDVA